MNTVDYIGESLYLGEWGKAMVALSFVAALFSTISYLLQAFNKKETDHSWLQAGRIFFVLHGLSVVGVFSLLIYLIYNHYFEYHFVWTHSSIDMDAKYILACIWEGQEGSFLLWIFWHVVLSVVLIWKSKVWESHVMSVIMLVQVFLCSMIVGIWIGDLHIGSSPFILLREHPDMFNMPFLQNANYLEGIIERGGRGLNPLLQNYWMTIHPPTLFLGFASTVIPFAFALSALITGRVREWIKPSLPYTYFSIAILGVGILMGAAWAYEALSFGGFWAWDPVENASLIPWITMVAAGHVMMITNRTGAGLPTAIFLAIISFLLILYSTFLTRSGILGESSVHAFTDLGMQGQLLLYMLFFTVLSLGMYIIYRKRIFYHTDEEKSSSREFWIFIGVMVLSVSALQIFITTSIPVYNKITGSHVAPPVDVIDHYNKWQIPISSFILLIMAFAQFFKWKQTDVKMVFKKIWLSVAISLVLTILYQWYLQLPRIQHSIMMFACLFAFTANIDYFIRVTKGKINFGGASIAHAGIALILLGALVSNAGKTVISENKLNVDLGKDFPNNENVMLIKNDTAQMKDYFVSYTNKEQEGKHIYYNIDYFKLNRASGSLEKKFTLKPFIQLNERMGNVAEPSTKHFIDKDIYTYVQYADLEDKKNSSDYTEPRTVQLGMGDTVSTSFALVILDSIRAKTIKDGGSQMEIAAHFTALDINNKRHNIEAIYKIENLMAYSEPVMNAELGLQLAFTGVKPKENKIDIQLSEKKSNKREFIIMKAIVFPHINILWLGCLLLVIGTWVAIAQRIRLNRNLRA
ncbi:MAG: cytochrome c biogenesis protein CcsA [Bacteroidetes bacterium]|nr:cytochrome c biogenesis protein CcsA [Bacteroidota bacterium]